VSGERRHSGLVVEGVRLIVLGLFAAGGYAIAEALDRQRRDLAIMVILGVLVGYVAGGVFGRGTAAAVSAAERSFRTASAAELLAGTAGLIAGLLIAFLLSFPLLRLPAEAGYPAVAFAYLVLGYLGERVARAKRDDLFALFGLKSRAAASGSGDVTVVDTSALVDGRVVDVVRAGFLSGTLLVPGMVLRELQSIGDASDPARRSRGRRGLDAVRELQVHPDVDVVVIEDPAGAGDVDAALVRLAREHRAGLLTNDTQLQKVAGAVGVPVRSVARLAGSLRVPVSGGDDLQIGLSREGREHGQGVGFLDDGTMVVVEGGSGLVGSSVRVTVTNVIDTANGRMLFARLPVAAS